KARFGGSTSTTSLASASEGSGGAAGLRNSSTYSSTIGCDVSARTSSLGIPPGIGGSGSRGSSTYSSTLASLASGVLVANSSTCSSTSGCDGSARTYALSSSSRGGRAGWSGSPTSPPG